MKKLVRFLPSHLNLNGDAANCDAISFYLNKSGIGSTVVDYSLGQTWSPDADFIVVGHGSMAAWNSLTDLKPVIAKFLLAARDNGALVLLVSSAISELADSLGLHVQPAEIERQSKFTHTEFENQKIVGYLNSDRNLPLFERQNGFWLTSLHGPLVAKNPQLLETWFSTVAVLDDQLQDAVNRARDLAIALADE